MKKAILYAVCLLIATSTFAAAPTSKLVSKFKETFPNAQNVKWTDDNEGFYASFSQNGNFNKVFYNKDGEFVYALKYSNGSELPTNVLMALNKKFGETKMVGVTEVTTQNGSMYNVKLTKDDKLYAVNVTSYGTITNQESYNDATTSAVAGNN